MSEDEAWKELEDCARMKERNRTMMQAWEASGNFALQSGEKLSRMTLKDAFEQGFLEGYKQRGEMNANSKGR